MAMSRLGGPDKKVIMTDVEPGEKTGVYYMPICNLPFGTSWQDFKDWIRVDCEVDHVELFQSSTSGWIRLRGEENFNRAWSRLKNDYFRNRAIIASDKNRTETIKIKELVDSRVAQYGKKSSWEDVSPISRTEDVPLPQSRSCIQEATSAHSPLVLNRGFTTHLPTSLSCPVGFSADGGLPVSEPYGAETYNSIASSSQQQSMAYAPAYDCYEPRTEVNLMSHSQYPISHYVTSSPPADFQYPTSNHHHHLPIAYSSCAVSYSNYTLESGPRISDQAAQRSGYTPEEPCKVVITSIQHKARQSDVLSWIQHQVGEYASAISSINIPLGEPKNRIRGHAFITLTNATAAEATVRILDKKLFQGRVVSTRLTTEGVTDSERPGGSKRRGTISGTQQGQTKSEHASRVKEGSGRSSTEAKHHSSSKGRPSASSSSSVGNSSKHSTSGKKAESGPVIAHGSSTRKADRKK